MATAFQSNAFQASPAFQIEAEAAQQRGGAFYPTPEELRAFRRAEKLRRKREKEEADLLDATVRDAYERVAEPEVRAARIAAVEELEDEEDMLRLLVAIARKGRL